MVDTYFSPLISIIAGVSLLLHVALIEEGGLDEGGQIAVSEELVDTSLHPLCSRRLRLLNFSAVPILWG
jgi:hypothetical protein